MQYWARKKKKQYISINNKNDEHKYISLNIESCSSTNIMTMRITYLEKAFRNLKNNKNIC